MSDYRIRMVGLACAVFVLMLLVPHHATAYDAATHGLIAQKAFEEYASLRPGAEWQTYYDVPNSLLDINAGTRDEDSQDHVFGYGGVKVTYTHFWDADKGWYDEVDELPVYNAPNAFVKATGCGLSGTGYTGLWEQAVYWYGQGRKDLAYELLGHISHLIADMSVPAHVHELDHSHSDSYEDFVEINSEKLIQNLDRAELNKGLLRIPWDIPPECQGLAGLSEAAWPLYYLMWTTNQRADILGSDSRSEGDTDWGAWGDWNIPHDGYTIHNDVSDPLQELGGGGYQQWQYYASRHNVSEILWVCDDCGQLGHIGMPQDPPAKCPWCPSLNYHWEYPYVIWAEKWTMVYAVRATATLWDYWDHTVANVQPPDWTAEGGGSYHNPSNWMHGYGSAAPNGGDAQADFLGGITAPSTVTLDGLAPTLAKINFQNTNSYTIAGGAWIRMEAPWSEINVLEGNHTIAVPLHCLHALDVTTYDNTSLTLKPYTTTPLPPNGLVKHGGGSLVVVGPNPIQGTFLWLEGGELVLAAATPATDLTFENIVWVAHDSTLTAGSGGGAGTAGPLTLILDRDVQCEYYDDCTLQLRTTDDYTLNVAGTISGVGKVEVTEGTVILSASGNAIGHLAVSGGRLDTGGNAFTIFRTLKLGNATFSLQDADSFQVSGSDLLRNDVPREITLSGGKLSVNRGLPAMPAIATDGLVEDLSADLGLTLDGDDLVSQWANQAASGGDDVAQADPSLQPKRLAGVLNGHNALQFTENIAGAGSRMFGDNRDAFNGLIDGSGNTWLVVARVGDQTDGDNNRFFGTLTEADYSPDFTGICPGVDFNEVPYNLTRAGGHDTTIGPAPIGDGRFHIFAGRLAAGIGLVQDELFVDESAPAAVNPAVTVNPGINSDLLSIGVERLTGQEDFVGDIARILIYDRPLSDAELFGTALALQQMYMIDAWFGLADVSATDLRVTADSTLELFEGGELGSLVLQDHVKLTVNAPTVCFRDVSGADGAAISADSLAIRGTLSPGNSVGTLGILGNLSQLDTAELYIEIAGPPESGLCDLLDVSGMVALDGKLTLDFLYTPQVGDSYTFLTAGSFEGAFAELSVLGLDPGLVDYNMTGGQFAIVPEPGTMTLLAIAGTLLLLAKRRRR